MQKQQLEEDRRIRKEEAKQQLEEDRRIRKEEAERQERLHAEQERLHVEQMNRLIQAFQGAPHHANVGEEQHPVNVSATAIPPFAAFDASTELGTDY